MKRIFLTFASSAFIMTACNQNDVIDSVGQDNDKLIFNTAIGKQTRVAELVNNELQTAASSANRGIVLYAYQESTTAGSYNPWFNDKLWYASSNWTIASTRFRNAAATKYITYFPTTNVTQSGTTFANANFAASGGVFPKFSYIVGAAGAQEDLIAGITDVAANKTDVVLKMRHILSQVNFGVKGYKGAQIAISNIQIHNIFNSATYTYGSTDTYMLGAWSDFGTDGAGSAASASYTYSKKGGAVPINRADVETVKTGDVYIFGDGGSFGPGKVATVWYPSATGDAWVSGDKVTDTEKMSNSLMLMPQDFRAVTNLSNKDGYVTFNYTITDVSGAFVASNATGWFKLDFTPSNASAYASQWKQNLRYVYIIDFEDFLSDNKLAFKVDVRAYPWENYNNGSGNPDDGIVGVEVIGQPTENVVNGITNGQTLYAASRSTTAATTDVQLLSNEIWHWDVYAFAGLTATGELFSLNFSNVIFNGKKITINVGTGYKVYIGTEADTQTVDVTSSSGVVVIKKK